jgi:FtsZ-interacting cell division protein YlmF
MSVNDWLRGKRRTTSDDFEYYEDTHDSQGNYVGRQQNDNFILPQKGYGNINVYCPSTPKEVENLINFLRNGEPVIADLNENQADSAQRILDFISGGVYALGGNIYRIKENIFLLSPSGVEIQSQYDNNK